MKGKCKTSLNPYSNGTMYLILRLRSGSQTRGCLNPYSNGTMYLIRRHNFHSLSYNFSLNPYSNGTMYLMKETAQNKARRAKVS